MELGINGMAGSPPESVVEGVERAAADGLPDPKADAQSRLAASDVPRAGETWQHYKGGRYRIVATALKEDTLAPMVVYRSIERGYVWIRDLANFTEVVETEGIAGRPVPYRRFSRVGRPKDDVAKFDLAAKISAVGGSPEEAALDDRPQRKLEEIRAICLAEGIGFGTPVDSVRMLAARARKWAESVKAIEKSASGYPPGSIAEQRFREETEQHFESMGAALDDIRAICRDVAGVDAGSATESVRVVAERARKWAESARPAEITTDVPQDGKPPEVALAGVVRLLRGAGYHVDADSSACDCVGELIARSYIPKPDVSRDGKPPGTVTRSEFEGAVRFGIENGAPMGDPTIDDGDDVSPIGEIAPLESMHDAWIALQLVIARLETAGAYLSTPPSVIGAILVAADEVKFHLDRAMGEAEGSAGIEPDEAPG